VAAASRPIAIAGSGLWSTSMATAVATSAARAPGSPATAMGTMMAISTELAMVLMKLSTRGLMRTNDITNTPPKRVIRVTKVMMAVSAITPMVVGSMVTGHRPLVIRHRGFWFQPEQADQTTGDCANHHVHIGWQPLPGGKGGRAGNAPGDQHPWSFLTTQSHGQQETTQNHIQPERLGVL